MTWPDYSGIAAPGRLLSPVFGGFLQRLVEARVRAEQVRLRVIDAMLLTTEKPLDYSSLNTDSHPCEPARPAWPDVTDGEVIGIRHTGFNVSEMHNAQGSMLNAQ